MIEIRPLTTNDRTEAFSLICRDLLDETDPTTPSDETAAADFRRINAAIDRHIADDSEMYWPVAIENGNIIGVCMIAMSHMADDIWELGNLVVAYSYRKNGIGSNLLKHCEKYAASHGCELVLALRCLTWVAGVLACRRSDRSSPLGCGLIGSPEPLLWQPG